MSRKKGVFLSTCENHVQQHPRKDIDGYKLEGPQQDSENSPSSLASITGNGWEKEIEDD
ncbi:MAG TPA: hypothetical protein VJ742_12670 [Nitrososphaera sp.]|nr:hypothetical protein [Nitrososphaera sp.]